MFTLIQEQSNLYSLQTTGSSANITVGDIRKFVAILILQGIVEISNYRDYWNKKFEISLISKIFNSAEGNTGFKKVKGLLNLFQRNIRSVPNELHQNIDEMMIPYKGKG